MPQNFTNVQLQHVLVTCSTIEALISQVFQCMLIHPHIDAWLFSDGFTDF